MTVDGVEITVESNGFDSAGWYVGAEWSSGNPPLADDGVKFTTGHMGGQIIDVTMSVTEQQSSHYSELRPAGA